MSKTMMAILDHYKEDKIHCMTTVHLAKELGVVFNGMLPLEAQTY